MILPIAYLGAITLIPIFLWLSRSVLDPEPTLIHFQKLIDEPVYVRILGNTFRVSIITTLFCLAVGYPVAYRLASMSARSRQVILLFVLLPFWTSVLVRSFAWLVTLSPVGPVNDLLVGMGVAADPLQLTNNSLGTLIGMSSVLMPYGVLVMLASMLTIDRNLLAASATLGARPGQSFLCVFLPLSMPGVIGAGLLLFLESLGFFITPALLGGPSDTMLAQSIEQQINLTLDWGFAAVLAILLLASTLVVYLVYARVGLGLLWGTVGAQLPAPLPSQTGAARKRARMVARVAHGLSRVSRSVNDAASNLAGAASATHRRMVALRLIASGIAMVGLVLMVLPTVVLFPMSLNPGQFLGFPKGGLSLRWYELFLTSPSWQAATVTSFRVGLISAAIATMVGTAAAFGLVRLTGWRRPTVAAFVLSPMVVPKIVIAISAYYVFARLRLIGPDQIGLILTHAGLGIPFVTISVMSSLQGFDRRLEHAALSLGASPMRVYRYVVLPLVRPGILAGAVFAFIASFEDLIISLFLTSGSFKNLPKQMWDDLSLNAKPTLAAIGSILIVLTSILLLSAFIAREIRARPDAGREV